MTILQGGLPWELVAEKFMRLKPDEQEVMRTFHAEHEAEMKAAKAAAAAAAMGGRTSLPAPGGDKPSAQAVADVLAQWGMLAQEEAERQGLPPFAIGLEERRRRAMEALWEVGYEPAGVNGNGH